MERESGYSRQTSARTIVVGVEPGQPDVVLTSALDYAKHFNATLICAWADPARYRLEESAGGEVLSVPLDPDEVDEEVEPFEKHLRPLVEAALASSGVDYELHALAGSPAEELARLADEVDALMIIVGTREAGLRSSLREFFNGSIAVHLAHHQQRPVVVIPLARAGETAELPWREDIS